MNDTNTSAPIKVTYDQGDPEGDCSAMAFYKDGKCIGQLVGEASEYVYHALHRLVASNMLTDMEESEQPVDSPYYVGFDLAKGDDTSCLVIRKGNTVVLELYGEQANAVQSLLKREACAENLWCL